MKTKLLWLALLALFLLAAGSARAQTGTVTVSASHLGGPTPVTGTITFQPVASDGITAISAKLSGGGITTKKPITATVTAGAFTMPNVIDTSLSNPVNVCYTVTVRDTTGLQNLGPGFTCVQPAANNVWCTSGVCNFDNYIPNLGSLALSQPGGPGPSAYQVAVANGYGGTQTQWLASLHGTDGTNGANGVLAGIATAASDPSGYTSLNPAGLLNTTTLTQGATTWQNGAQAFGFDFGYAHGLGFMQRVFGSSTGSNGVGIALHGSFPTTQASFTIYPLYANAAGIRFYPDPTTGIAPAAVDASGNAAFNSLGIQGHPFGPTGVSMSSGLQYSNLNPNTLISGSTLNAGQCVAATGTAFYCQDFVGPYAAMGFQNRTTAPDNGTITWGFHHFGGSFAVPSDVYIYGAELSPARWCFWKNPTTGACLATLDSSGNFAAASIAMPTGTGVPVSDATLGNQAASLVQVEAYIAARSTDAFVVPRSGMAHHAYGDSLSIGFNGGAGAPFSPTFPQMVATALGATLTNYAVSSDEAADLNIKVFTHENPCSTSDIYYTMQIGSSDSRLINGGVGPYEQVFNLAYQGALSWLATRCEDRTQAGAVSATGWANYTGLSAVTGKTSTTNGAVISYSVTTYGKPIYVWSLAQDSNPGSFTLAVDGSTAATVNGFAPVAIATPNGVTSLVQVTRIPVAAGTHTVTITQATAGTVTLIAVGSPSANVYYTNPSVAVGDVIPVQGDGYQVADAEYTMDVLADIQPLISDGLDIRFANSRAALLDGAMSIYSAANDPHPNESGYAIMAKAFAAALQRAPAKSVNRAVPLSSGAGCTPGEVWAGVVDLNVYACKAYGVILRMAATTF